ncbi:uncharacterized protein MYCFIDRAFT_202076 [Pseudocercospora fijiensis CIRAD86]|uniref:CID domain-containing protein n=1 Tax=Pseudocercospora fijiensis (strain CIRAD86) TaxID=383855 RepID=M3B7K4_PSEFD|nr:uncharacterized protein MYCFIDRAFT_202076 [Pseudocercospora fijiensis CIRAD86]EME85298.1 hypothetical protein MYCFIDRAFT_202076 [Pseudocercospora fijiensis CIRAD86]
MSSKSPRGSFSVASSSDEVAKDFEESLRDLQSNNRYEISNLTVIAKENTEHAQAISRALEGHIKTTSPTRKLPALFLLDSIVKNVGTPYTVYLGRNLYSTFMDAYTLVDGATRRHMEGMLKTWKEPVPGSIDPRPVFPLDTVRPIDNALNRAKAAVQQRQGMPQMPFRAMATPPQHNGQYPTPPPHGFPPHHANDIDAVKRDIDGLVPRFQYQLATRPGDDGLQKQLGALQALRTLLDTQRVSPPELQEIKNQVSRLSPGSYPPPQATPQPPVPTPQWQPPVPIPQPYQQPPVPFPAATPQPPQQPAPPNLTPTALNGLQALLANVPKPSTPQMRAAMPGFRDATHSQLNAIQNHAAAPPLNDTADLLSSLAKAGLIKPVPQATPNAPLPAAVAPPPPDATASLLKSLQSILPPKSQTGTPTLPPAQPVPAAVPPVTAASLKVFRPELVFALYDAQPNQCSTCGRRFLATDEGREKKSLHLDWHFRTNQRIADPNLNRGHHRNWYVDEMAWITHTEFDPSTTTATTADSEAANKVQKGPQDQSVRAPAGMTKNTCSICFEEMKSSYSEDMQDWIFANATYYNGKIVHATCLAEMTRSQVHVPAVGGSLAATFAGVAGQRERSSTPDSLKRKAETAMAGQGSRMRFE